MHNHDNKYPSRPGFKPGTWYLNLPIENPGKSNWSVVGNSSWPPRCPVDLYDNTPVVISDIIVN